MKSNVSGCWLQITALKQLQDARLGAAQFLIRIHHPTLLSFYGVNSYGTLSFSECPEELDRIATLIEHSIMSQK